MPSVGVQCPPWNVTVLMVQECQPDSHSANRERAQSLHHVSSSRNLPDLRTHLGEGHINVHATPDSKECATKMVIHVNPVGQHSTKHRGQPSQKIDRDRMRNLHVRFVNQHHKIRDLLRDLMPHTGSHQRPCEARRTTLESKTNDQAIREIVKHITQSHRKGDTPECLGFLIGVPNHTRCDHVACLRHRHRHQPPTHHTSTPHPSLLHFITICADSQQSLRQYKKRRCTQQHTGAKRRYDPLVRINKCLHLLQLGNNCQYSDQSGQACNERPQNHRTPAIRRFRGCRLGLQDLHFSAICQLQMRDIRRCKLCRMILREDGQR
mmetsp:Transcript_19626/g.42229  ORF Transcript_19626/g.42229 Transcript_19626/m.42229 type:complete len:322 (-) Transcript_19626:366-1331(-)